MKPSLITSSHPFSEFPGLFSFKNYQLMSVTDSLFRRSGRAVSKPTRTKRVQINV